MTLSKGQIEEAMGRAALVAELNEVEQRLNGITGTIKQLKIEANQPGESGEEAKKVVVEASVMGEQLSARREAILTLLWHPEPENEEPKTWQEKLQALPREEALVTVEAVLRRRPEVSPPEGVDEWEPPDIRDWLIEKIGELPEDERDAWTRP